MNSPKGPAPLPALPPNAPSNPFVLMPGETPCDLLPRLYAALYGGAAGSGVVEVRQKDDWIKFAPPNIGQLRAEIRRLEAICGRPHTRSRRAGPYHNPMARPMGSYGAWPYYPYGW